MLAVPSTPSPQTPTRRVSERGPGDRLAHSGPGCGGCPSGARRVARSVTAAAAGAAASSSARSRWRTAAGRTVLPVRPPAARRTGTPRCHRRTRTACRRPPSPSRARNRSSLAGVLERLVAGEHDARSARVHEGRQDEVDEAALVAAAAPVVEAPRRILVEGAVAAAKDPVVLGELCEPLGHPQLACAGGGRRTRRGRARAWRGRARRNSRSNSSPLDHWWLTAWPSSTSVGTDADHSLDSTTASRRSSTAATTAAAVITAVTGTCPLRNPSSSERRTRGSISRAMRVTGRPVAAAASSMAAKRSPGGRDDAQRGSGCCPADERLHRHDGVDAAAEGDQRAARSEPGS